MWTLAVQNSDELIYIWSFEPVEKCTTFKDIYPGLSRTLSSNFQDQSDFPGPGIFKKKSRTFQEVWKPHARHNSRIRDFWS